MVRVYFKFIYMYPDLSYFFHDLLGTPYDNWTSIFKTFGLFLALAFLASAYVVKLELQRKEKEGILKPVVVTVKEDNKNKYLSLLINILTGFIIGFKLLYILSNTGTFISNPAAVLMSLKGSFTGGLLFALLYGGYTYWDLKKKDKKEKEKVKTKVIHPYEYTGNITLIAAISGLIGARLFSILENLDDFYQNPWEQLLSGSGLTIYGGLILAFIAVYIYVKKKGIPPIHMMDIAALAIIIGYAVGRLGCHFSGDGDWGIVNTMPKPSWFILPDWMWSYDYPHNVAQQGVLMENCQAHYCRKLEPGVFPTPIYESIISFMIFFFLWSIRKRIKIPGLLFFIYLVLQGIERFFIETIRVNPKYDFMGLHWSQAQYISVLIFLTGIAGIIYLTKFKKYKYG